MIPLRPLSDRRPRRPGRVASVLAALAILLSFTGSAEGQQAGGLSLPGEQELVDRVVAVVGDSVVLESQVLQRMLQLQAQGMDLPDDSAARADLQQELVQTLVDEQLVIQAAIRDSTIVVDPQRVDAMVSEDLAQRARSFGGQDALRDALRAQGMTLAGFREMLRTDARSQQLRNQFLARRQQTAGSVPVSESEMRAFFEENRDRLGERPASITFEQVILRPSATDSAMAEARAKAEALLDSLRGGEKDFEELAEAHSDDPGSRTQGGSLGWFRRGQMVPAFEDVVFSLPAGGTSGIVETEFGLHIIRVDRIRGAERRARHILVSPPVGPEDVEQVRTRAEELVEQLGSGTSMDSIQARYGGDEGTDSLTVAREQLTNLPPGYLEALRNAEAGDVVGPVEWSTQGRTSVAVIQVTDVREAGAFTFEEVQPQIRQRLQQEKLLDQVFAELRAQSYVEIRM